MKDTPEAKTLSTLLTRFEERARVLDAELVIEACVVARLDRLTTRLYELARERDDLTYAVELIDSIHRDDAVIAQAAAAGEIPPAELLRQRDETRHELEFLLQTTGLLR